MNNWSISNQTPLADTQWYVQNYFMAGVAEGIIGLAAFAVVGGLAYYFIKKLKKAATSK